MNSSAMKPRNILFIMADQLRADYLSCNGHPLLQTPTLDALAKRGVNFSRAYCQGPVCGSSRASFYTGRYVASHGATYNDYPLRVSELTLGDHLRPLGYRTALVGKTHMRPDLAGMQRLGIDPASDTGVFLFQAGFEPFERDDGLHPDQNVRPDLRYNQWLRDLGYDSPNPWHDYANSAESKDGELLSGWYLRNTAYPARVQEAHSETAYMTNRAMEFIAAAGEQPWCLHLSYIKPHWPYIAPAPYHAMYRDGELPTAQRHPDEYTHAHPVQQAFMQHAECQLFSQVHVRHNVLPTYMGLIRQIDDHLGRLFQFMAKQNCLDQTLIVFTSDHGDYLGDHWLGEKELFHEPSVRIPLIVVDPDARADATRGHIDDRLVEAIDLIPTFIDWIGGELPDHILEGRSLLPLLQGKSVPDWRSMAVSELDYSCRPVRQILNLAPAQCRATMLRTELWKYVHYNGFRPQLFDLKSDPQELHDIAREQPDLCREFSLKLLDWLIQRRNRTTISDEQVMRRTGTHRKRGYLFDVW